VITDPTLYDMQYSYGSTAGIAVVSAVL